MKKIIIVICLVLCVMLCASLIACNDNQNSTEQSTSQGTPQEANQQGSVEQGSGQALLEMKNVTLANASYEYDGQPHSLAVANIPEGASVVYSGNEKTEVGEYTVTATINKTGYKTVTLSSKLTITVPSAGSIIKARSKANQSDDDNYDFFLNFAGNVEYMGYSGTANANYDAKYRYKKSTDELSFVRTTSGILLYDGSEYITTIDGSKVYVKTNEDNKIKKIKVVTDSSDSDVTMINMPIVSLIDSLKAENLTNIKTSDSDYKFQANLTIHDDNPLIQKLIGIIAKQGTSISVKGMSFTNPVGGVIMYFNLNEKMSLTDFALSFDFEVPTNEINANFTLSYKQNASNTTIKSPGLNNVIFGDKISTEIASINNAFDAVKNASSYSLGVTVKNEFDPGWNVSATKDSYTATMFKNTYDVDDSAFTAFNHSFEYKTHHDTDGKETYKYTIGNLADGSVYLISRKGTNTQTAVDNISANSQFEWLTSSFRFDSTAVEAMVKNVSGTTVTYDIYLKNDATLAVNDNVAIMINSNEAEGVVDVNNYFNANDYNIKESTMTVVINAGGIETVSSNTKIQYTPTNGDYIDKVVTLTDSISLTVNEKLSDAKDYKSPEKLKAAIGKSLNDNSFYIN